MDAIHLHIFKDHTIGRVWQHGRFLSFEPMASDIHGLNHPEQRHVRILYVDERYSVRSISVITTITDPPR